MVTQVPMFKPQVAQQQLPGSKVSVNTDSGSDAIGAGISSIGVEMQIKEKEAERQAKEEQAKADDIAGNTAFTEAIRAKIDATTEYSKYGGLMALKNGPAAEKAYSDRIAAIESSLANEDQKAQFRAQINPHLNDFHGFVSNRMSSEGYKVDDNGIAGIKASLVEDVGQKVAHGQFRKNADGTLTVESAEKASEDGIQKISEYYARNVNRFGGAAEAKRLAGIDINEYLTNVHSKVIAQFLAADDDQSASQYFNQVSRQLTSESVEKIRPVVERGAALGQAQRLEESVWDQFYKPDSATPIAQQQLDAENWIRANVKDPKQKDLLLNRVGTRFQHTAAIQQDVESERFNQFKQGIISGFGIDNVIKSPEYAKLSGQHQEDLLVFDAAIQSRAVREGDWDFYQKMLDDLLDKKKPFNPARYDIEAAHAKLLLSDKQYELLHAVFEARKTGAGLTDKQSSADDEKNAKILAGAYTAKDVVNMTADSLFIGMPHGEKATTEQKTAYERAQNRFKKAVNDDAISIQTTLDPPRELTGKEWQEIADKWARRLYVNGGNEYRVASELVNDIPVHYLATIMDQFADEGEEPSEKEVRKRYVELLRREALK